MDTIAYSVAATQQYIDTTLLLPGNVIPHFWYNKFKDESGGPDLISIILLSEIVFWYRPSTTHFASAKNLPQLTEEVLAISYEYLEQKFYLGKERVRRSLKRLEDHKVITREIRNIKLSSGKRGNQLFIHLDKEFLNSCFRISEITVQTTDNFEIQSQHECGDHISNKNKNIKNRSMRSNFIQNSLNNLNTNESNNSKTKTSLLSPIVFEEKNLNNILKSRYPFVKTRHLKDFYPLSTEENLELKHLSGRDFSLNAMNEILLDISRKKPNWSCESKKGFMLYMAEVLKFEKRQAVLISGEGFKIRNNMTEEETNSKLQEKFLSEIENSLQTSPEMHFKKKLAAVLDPNIAYKFLNSYISSTREGDVFKITLNKPVELSSKDEDIILHQVKATHEKLSGEELVFISRIEFKTNINSSIQESRDELKELPSGIWGNMRLKLIKHFGNEGKAIDESWFSKLSAEIDEGARIVTLKAPSSFMRDWINNKYGSLLEGLCRTEDFKLNAIS